MKLAAIDIGSNAARLLISEISREKQKKPTFKKVTLVRVPLRLGFDVFESGQISPEKTHLLLETMKAFLHLKNAFGIEHMLACATSAMRDADNTPEILQLVKDTTGIDIEVISGSKEASFVFENHIVENLDKNHSYLYIDVGGGSTELTYYSNNRMIFKDSFDIGTIRLLKKQTTDKQWQRMKDSIQKKIKAGTPVIAIGSGGNINKVYSLSKKKEGKALPVALLRKYYKDMSNVSMQDRMTLYNLKEDRADVILPALQIYLNIMKWAGITQIYVPKIGLADGLIQHLYKEVSSKKK